MLRIVLMAVVAAALMLFGPTIVVRAHAEEGRASWYGPGFHGHKTASGQRFNQWSAVCAHKHLPFGSVVRVTNLGNGRQATCRIADRGPYAEGRIIDVSRGVAARLNMLHSGTARVRVEVVK